MRTIIEVPNNTKEYEAIYAILSIDGNGNHGIVALDSKPLLCGDDKNVSLIVSVAKEEVKPYMPEGYKLALFKFADKELIEEI